MSAYPRQAGPTLCATTPFRSDHALLVDTVQSLADMIRSLGVKVAFRPRLASFHRTEEEMERFLEETEPELLALPSTSDTWH